MIQLPDTWAPPDLFSTEPSLMIAETITWARHPQRRPRPFFPDDETPSKLGALVEYAGLACYHWDRSKHLTEEARWAAAWAADASGLTEDEIWQLVRAEYDRADHKHSGMTPLNPDMSDDDRAAILCEEVGEVARALTPDAHTPTGHGGNLVNELVQVATMATAWLTRVLADKAQERAARAVQKARS